MFWESRFFASATEWPIAALGVLAALGGYGLLAALGLRYDPAWPGPPAGARAVARRPTALLAGMACVAVAALGALGRSMPPAAQVVALAQAALMAAAAVCDWRKWQLPLPFTLSGIALGVAGLALAGSPLMWGLAAVTIVAALLINTLATSGTLQGGDVLASAWIGLALPVVGLLAFAVGQAGLAAAGRIGRWTRAARAPVGGAWLMAAALLLALPGLPALIETAQDAPAARPRPGPAAAASDPRWRETARAAGDATAWVAFADTSAERASRAARAAARVRALARDVDAPAEIARALSDLADALDAYDLDAIRGASARLADRRDGFAVPMIEKEP